MGGYRQVVASTMPIETSIRSEQRDAAFRRYVLPEIDVLLRVAMRLTRDPSDAEDLVQDTVLRAYRAVDRFDGRYPRAWLLTILRNTNINRARKKRPVLLHDPDRSLETITAGGADGRDGPAEIVTEPVPDRAVVDALRGLSDKYRDVVILVDVEGLSYKEAASVLDVPLGTVMSRLHRARNRIREQLATAGYIPGVPR